MPQDVVEVCNLSTRLGRQKVTFELALIPRLAPVHIGPPDRGVGVGVQVGAGVSERVGPSAVDARRRVAIAIAGSALIARRASVDVGPVGRGVGDGVQ
eukprot:2806010-Prymnesium_polylepis.1